MISLGGRGVGTLFGIQEVATCLHDPYFLIMRLFIDRNSKQNLTDLLSIDP